VRNPRIYPGDGDVAMNQPHRGSPTLNFYLMMGKLFQSLVM